MFMWLKWLLFKWLHVHRWLPRNEIIRVKEKGKYVMKMRQRCERCGATRLANYYDENCRECGAPLCVEFVRQEGEQNIYAPVCLNPQCTNFGKQL